MLASFLVDELSGQPELRDNVYFFFFKDDNEEQRDATFALSALLHQLFIAKRLLIRHAMKDFNSKGAQFTKESDTLWRIFKAATTDPNCGDVICIIDALDECEESTRKELIESLVSISSSANRTGRNTDSESFPKFILTSRPYGSIERQFGSSPTIRLKAEEQIPAISADIELVVNSEVEALVKAWHLTDGDRTHLREKLLKGADRTFLWVSLIVKQLKSSQAPTRRKFLQILNNLPSDLDAMYERILGDSCDREEARRILQIVIAAARPLTLDEMQIALAIQPDHKSIEDLEPDFLYSIESTVKDICGLFVRVIDSKIYLIHQTAKEFLKRSTTIPATESSHWKQSLCPIESNLALANICINYLLFTVFETHPLVLGSTKSAEEIACYVGEHQFLDYAAKHWASHALEAKIWEGGGLSGSALEVLDSRSGRLLTWFLVYQTTIPNPHRPQTVSGLAVASYIGHDRLVELLIQKGADVNCRHDLHGSALNAAAVMRHSSVVELLLNRGAVVYLDGKECQNLLQVNKRSMSTTEAIANYRLVLCYRQ